MDAPTVAQITAAIAAMDAPDLDTVVTAYKQRSASLRKAADAARLEATKKQNRETMARVKGWKVGSTVYFGTDMKRGWLHLDGRPTVTNQTIPADTAATVWRVLPRKHVVWLKFGKGIAARYPGGLDYFDMRDVRMYQISPTEPAVRRRVAGE